MPSKPSPAAARDGARDAFAPVGPACQRGGVAGRLRHGGLVSRRNDHGRRPSPVIPGEPKAREGDLPAALRSPGSPSPPATASPPAGDDRGGSGSPGAARTTVIPGEPKAREGDPVRAVSHGSPPPGSSPGSAGD